MPWNEVSAMTLRNEFIILAVQNIIPFSELCRRFNISRKTGYKWLNRCEVNNLESCRDQSKRPINSPNKTSFEIEELIKNTRLKFPEWGGRKLKRYLENEGELNIPAASTITAIIKRNDLLSTSSASSQASWIRFEHEQPNDLWQMDFKGPISTSRGHGQALTILDDHSRFSLGIQICKQQTHVDTRKALTEVFRCYGLPKRMTMDNGNPWGIAAKNRHFTSFAVWLIEQDIRISHSRPYHPQTQGKDERFHRSLKAEVLTKHQFTSRIDLQKYCEEWRQFYNNKRPHDALNLAVPASRYQISQRKYQEKIVEFEYSPGDEMRRIHSSGSLKYKGKIYYVGEALCERSVAVRKTQLDGVLNVFYRHQRIAKLDLRD